MSSSVYLPEGRSTSSGERPRFIARALSHADISLLVEAQRLRADVFARELGWTLACACGREHDRYDAVATHIVALAMTPGCARCGDLTGRRVAGYARILLPEHTFMLQREFAALLPDGFAITEPRRSFEVSRFAVSPALRGLLDADGYSASEHLQRGVAQWALDHRRDQLYSVCETRHVRALRLRGLPVQRFGRVVEYTPGVRTCAISLDLSATRRRLDAHRPRDARWYAREVSS